MMTKKAKYALMALGILAQSPHTPMVIADIAVAAHIPKKFLELILLELKKSDVLDSKKGQGGGYILNRSPNQIRIMDIIKALSGSTAPVVCLDSGRLCDECTGQLPCAIRSLMADVHRETTRILYDETLQSLMDRKTQLAGSDMFYI